MKYTYNKLVRDKIPSEIDSINGRKATWRIMDNDEYLKELNRKLVEEAHEFIEENDVKELADVIEVIESIMNVKHTTWEDVRKEQEIKRDRKGGFEDRIYLEYVEESEKNVEAERELEKSWRKTY